MNFKNPYSKADYLKFFQDKFLPDDFSILDENISLGFKPEHIKGVKLIGSVDSLEVKIYEVKHSSENDPRVSLSKDIFRIMRDYGTKYALILFISDNPNNYRFSFATISFSLEDKKVKKEYSNPRRYSFFLGIDSKTHTPEEFLIKKGKVKDYKDLLSRFSVEVVNKEFYNKIALMFTKLVGGERKVGNKNKSYKPILKLPSTNDHQKMQEFAVRLIGRLVFCWFLKKKKSKNNIPLIPENILSKDAVVQHKNYYHSVLEKLFFKVLNTSMDERDKFTNHELYSNIPFLNGGLFEPHSDDYYYPALINKLVIPDDWLTNFIETLETYNFTIDENTSVDIDLSVDPEMLGRIFENLLAEINPETGKTARKSTGSYYTPRPIVEYMVDESLKVYLNNTTGIDENILSSLLSFYEQDIRINEEDKLKIINAIDEVKILDPACGSGAFPIGILQKMVLILQKIDPDSNLWFNKMISSIGDPVLKKDIKQKYTRNNLNFIRKFGLIQKCIYGVDIQTIAVEISKLRCFLTLIVDEETDDAKANRGIIPLPNLEFKFVAANALIGLENDFGQVKMFDDKKHISKLEELRNEYFISSGKRKKEIEKEFEVEQKQLVLIITKTKDYSGKGLSLASWNPFLNESTNWFDPTWMFGLKEGFQIVIGNPPYIGEKGNKKLFQEIKKNNLEIFYKRKMDLFYFFFHLALNITENAASIIFITTNYYLTADGALLLRKDLNKRSNIKKLINFKELKVFETALGQHNLITQLVKRNDKDEIAEIVSTYNKGVASIQTLLDILQYRDSKTTYLKIKLSNIYDGVNLYIRTYENVEINFNKIEKILKKIILKSTELQKIANISNGILTGVDKVTRKHIEKNLISENFINKGVFVLTDAEVDKLKLTPYEHKIIKPWFKNSDIQRYTCEQNTNLNLIYATRNLVIKDYPNIYNHFKVFEKVINARSKERGEIQAALKLGKWWVIFAARSEEVFVGEKIVCPQRSHKNTFGYNSSEWFASADVYFITSITQRYSLKYFLAILNSKLYFFWLFHKGKRKGDMLELYYTPLTQIPIYPLSLNDQQPYITRINQIISMKSKGSDTTKLENDIDVMVYKLYDLTYEEVKIVDPEFWMSVGEYGKFRTI